MIRVAALTSGRDVPSSRYRVRQHIASLTRQGIHVREFIPVIDKYRLPPWEQVGKSGRPGHGFSFSRLVWECAKLSVRLPGVMGSWQSDITWLERKIASGFMSLEPFLKRPYIFDVDDAIWLTMPPLGRHAAMKIARGAEIVIAGNTYIAEWFDRYAKSIRIVPTAIDTGHYRPPLRAKLKDKAGRFAIGWIGTASNYPGLYAIQGALRRFFDDHDSEFLIVSDKPPRFEVIPDGTVNFITWSQGIEIGIMSHMDIGIMPLPNNEWSRGKCSYKMLQYMALEIPVVVSPVGMNRDVLSMGDLGFSAKTGDDWYDALDKLYGDSSLRRRLGKNGREIVEQNFSCDQITPILASIFKEMI